MLSVGQITAFQSNIQSRYTNKTAAESISKLDHANSFNDVAGFLLGLLPNGIISGLDLSLSGSNVLVQPGTWMIDSMIYATVGVISVPIDAQDATYSRYDVLYADADGNVNKVSGALSLTPLEPAIPNDTVKLGAALITPTTVTLTEPPLTGYVDTTTNQDVHGLKNFMDGVQSVTMPLGDSSLNLATTEYVQNELTNSGTVYFLKGTFNGVGTDPDIGGTPYSINATNGLQLIGTDPIPGAVGIGGPLIKNTTIDNSAFSFTFSGSPRVPLATIDAAAVNFGQIKGTLFDTTLSGLAMASIGGNQVTVQPGTWRIGGLLYTTVSVTTLTIDVQDATLSRYDSVYGDNTGVLTIVSGALSATPIIPDIPTGTVRVGDILITPTTVTTLPTPPIINYVNTTANQTGIAGNKAWDGAHTFNSDLMFTGLTVRDGGYGVLEDLGNDLLLDTSGRVTLLPSYRTQTFALSTQFVGDYVTFCSVASAYNSETQLGKVSLQIGNENDSTFLDMYEIPFKNGITANTWYNVKPFLGDATYPWFAIDIRFNSTSNAYELRVRRTVDSGVTNANRANIYVVATPLNTISRLTASGNDVSSIPVYPYNQITISGNDIYDSAGVKFLKTGGGGGTGTVTSLSDNTANGVAITWATRTTTPVPTVVLGAITPTSTNGVSAATMAFMDATSSVQTQLNGKQASLGFTPYNATNPSGYITSASLPTAANPIASIGLTAVNGSAATFMRSDAAQAIDQTITPSWTGKHTFKAGILNTFNATSVSSIFGGTTVIQNVGANASDLIFESRTFGGHFLLENWRADGTAGSPIALATLTEIMAIGAGGYSGVGTNGGYTAEATSALQFITSQAWTATNNGTYALMNVTPNNSTVLTGSVKFDQDLSLQVKGNIVAGQFENPNVVADPSGYASVTAQGTTTSTNRGVFQVKADANNTSNTVGEYRFVSDYNTSGYIIARTYSALSGSTANNKGGTWVGQTKADGGALTTFMSVDSSQIVTLTNSGTPGDTSNQAATNSFVIANSTSGEPNYFYPGSLYKQSRLNIALNNVVTAKGAGNALAPIHLTFLGDSRFAYNPGYIVDAISQYGKINSIGWVAAYSNIWGSAMTTYTLTGGTTTRNDNTSAATWGISGTRWDCTTAATWTIQPNSRFPFDKFRIYYNKTVGGGTFSYAVDGGSTTNVNTDPGSGGDTLGVVIVNSGLNNQNSHSIVITGVSGSSRIYGIEFENQAEEGFVIDILQSGASTAQQWGSGVLSYASQFVGTTSAGTSSAMCTIWLDVNDANTSRTGTQFIADIRSIVSGLALPALSSPVFLTYMPQMTTNSSGVEDTTAGALMSSYRTNLLGGVATDGWSVVDAYKAYPTVAYMYTNGFYSDKTHFTISGAPFTWSTVVRSIMPAFNSLGIDANYPKFLRASSLIAPTGVAGFGLATMSGAGGLTETNTGWYGKISNGINTMYYNAAGTELLRMGSDGTTNTNIFSAYATSTYNTVLASFRQGSTSTNAWKVGTDGSGNMTISTNNANVAVTANTLAVTGAFTASSTATASSFLTTGNITAVAWGNATPASATGIVANYAAATYTDSSTATSATLANIDGILIKQPTFAASNTGVVYTTASTFHIIGAPVAGTNVTLSNSYSIKVDAGLSSFVGGISTNNNSTSSNLFAQGAGAIGLLNNTAAGLLFGGASNISSRSYFNGQTSTTITAANSYGGVIFGAQPVTMNTSGTTAWLSNVVVNSLGTVTNASVVPITNTASLFVGPASTAGTNNFTAYFDIGGIGIKEGTNGRVGQTTLVAGTKAITITGLTTSSRAFVELVTPGGGSLTIQYQAVCTANTLTLQANVAAGTINTADTSVLNYFVIN